MSQVVLAPVPTVAAGVAPAPTTWSSATNSISGAGDTFTRPVNPGPPVSVSPNPESA